MTAAIAIIGAANVGKSTLFNRLTKSRAALVGDMPGLTRDRHYGYANLEDRRVILIDTGGMQPEMEDDLHSLMVAQARMAIDEATMIIMMVDARLGVTHTDKQLAHELRRLEKPVFLVVNKTDGKDPDSVSAEFFELSLGKIYPIAATTGSGIAELQHVLLQALPEEVPLAENTENNCLRVGIVGRPNVGKSTLVNRLLGYERVIVFDAPGTTRDSIETIVEHRGRKYSLIDTAGMRRQSRIQEDIEKFSVVKTLQAIEHAQVVLVVLNAREGISEQDLHILGAVIDAGKALVVVCNQWDNLSENDREHVKNELLRRARFADFAELFYISALHGTNVGLLWAAIQRAFRAATKKLSTPEVTRILQKAVQALAPPVVSGRRIKLRYAHVGGHNPPIIVIHGTQATRLPQTYQRYLMNYFRDALKLYGTPIRIQLKSPENPFHTRKRPQTHRGD